MRIEFQNKEFLQSEQWSKFQQAVGRKTFQLKSENFSASLITHKLPMVGEYLYCPRGPVFSCHSERSAAESKNPELNITDNNIQGSFTTFRMTGFKELIELAKKENTGWIRIEPEDRECLDLIKENISEKIVKAPHDMQPREVFVLDIAKSEEQLLSEMKPKTRYNINLAKKKGVKIAVSNNTKYIDEFLRLTKEMAIRHGIATHPETYYRKMIASFPKDVLKIYVAQIDDQIIAANLVLFFENTATYLHGASGNAHRNLMAPFLLQWQAILDAKENGCTRYDFGGIKTQPSDNSWEGITQFKLGFSPNTKSIVFPGAYDIIINARKYAVYRGLQRAKSFAVKFRKK